MALPFKPGHIGRVIAQSVLPFVNKYAVRLTVGLALAMSAWPWHNPATLRLAALLIGAGLVFAVYRLALSLADAVVLRAQLAALKEIEEWFQIFVESAHALVWTSGRDWRRRDVDQSWCGLIGLGLGTKGCASWIEVIHPDDRSATVQALQVAAAEVNGFELEYRLRRADGEYRWVRDLGGPRVDAKGLPQGYFGVCMDITERKHREHARLEEATESVKEVWIAKLSALAERMEYAADTAEAAPAVLP